MRFIDNARDLWSKLWSVRLSLFAALLSGLEAGTSLYFDQRPYAALAACLVSIGSAIARLVAQPVAKTKAGIKADRRRTQESQS